MDLGCKFEEFQVFCDHWKDLCQLKAVPKLFGKDNLFVTDIALLMQCKTDFFAWVVGWVRGLRVGGSELRDEG